MRSSRQMVQILPVRPGATACTQDGMSRRVFAHHEASSNHTGIASPVKIGSHARCGTGVSARLGCALTSCVPMLVPDSSPTRTSDFSSFTSAATPPLIGATALKFRCFAFSEVQSTSMSQEAPSERRCTAIHCVDQLQQGVEECRLSMQRATLS